MIQRKEIILLLAMKILLRCEKTGLIMRCAVRLFAAPLITCIFQYEFTETQPFLYQKYTVFALLRNGYFTHGLKNQNQATTTLFIQA